MFRKNKRLDSNIFNKVFKEGYFFNTDFFSIKIFKGGDLKDSHFAYVVPKKTLKGVVERNFTKRKGYAAIREVIKQKHNSYYVILIPHHSALKLSFKELKTEIYKILKKSGFFNPKD